MQADCIFIRRSARLIVRRPPCSGLQTNLKSVPSATISFSNGAQNIAHFWGPARAARLKNTAAEIGGGDCPILSECLRDLKPYPELLALNDRKPQSPSAPFAIARCLSNVPSDNGIPL
jgi:hypothetical protein